MRAPASVEDAAERGFVHASSVPMATTIWVLGLAHLHSCPTTMSTRLPTTLQDDSSVGFLDRVDDALASVRLAGNCLADWRSASMESGWSVSKLHVLKIWA